MSLHLTDDWDFCKDKVYHNFEDDYYYVKGDPEKVPFVGVRQNSFGAGDSDELEYDSLIPADLFDTIKVDIGNPNNYKYAKIFDEKEANELKRRAIEAGIPDANRRLYTFMWTNVPPKDPIVKAMWDKAYDIIEKRKEKQKRYGMPERFELINLN